MLISQQQQILVQLMVLMELKPLAVLVKGKPVRDYVLVAALPVCRRGGSWVNSVNLHLLMVKLPAPG